MNEPLKASAAKYLNVRNGELAGVVEEVDGLVTFCYQGSETRYYLGRSEFDKRFWLQSEASTLEPSTSYRLACEAWGETWVANEWQHLLDFAASMPPASVSQQSVGASLEVVADAYAKDETASAAGVRAAFLAGAKFGNQRASNAFLTAMASTPTPPTSVSPNAQNPNAIAREALEFYADFDRWRDFKDDAAASYCDGNMGSELGHDMGEKARLALASTPTPVSHVMGPGYRLSHWKTDDERLETALDAFWNAAYGQGWNRTGTDDERGSAQEADDNLRLAIGEVSTLKQRIAELEDEVLEAQDAPWPAWADQILKTVRKYSGYDGYDDATDGVDLPGEVEETLEELSSECERLRAAAAPTPLPRAEGGEK